MHIILKLYLFMRYFEKMEKMGTEKMGTDPFIALLSMVRAVLYLNCGNLKGKTEKISYFLF